MSDTLLGAIIGAILAGAAMVLNSFVSNRMDESKETRVQRRRQHEKDLQELESLYEDALHSLDRLIRNQGRGSETELEAFYKYEVRLKLISTDEIVSNFNVLRSSIAEQAHKLPPYPEEFIPKFEDDDHRRERLEARKKAEEKRAKEWKTFLPDLYKQYKELSNFMKANLKLRKGA